MIAHTALKEASAEKILTGDDIVPGARRRSDCHAMELDAKRQRPGTFYGNARDQMRHCCPNRPPQQSRVTAICVRKLT